MRQLDHVELRVKQMKTRSQASSATMPQGHRCHGSADEHGESGQHYGASENSKGQGGPHLSFRVLLENDRAQIHLYRTPEPVTSSPGCLLYSVTGVPR